MAEACMILLSHTAGEMTVKVFDPLFGDPKKLPHLYSDNSALYSPNRARTLKHILPGEIQN